MKKLIALIAALSLALAAVPALAADTVFTNGYIYTVDEARTVAQALAVEDGKIAYVGDDDGAQAFIDDATEVIDLEGKMLMPGLIDGHIHSIMPQFFDIVLLGTTTLEETMDIIEAYIAEHPEKESFSGFGFMPSVFPDAEADNGPRKERLDAIESERPIVILSFDGHTVWCNSKYFEVYGITPKSQSPRGGIVVLDEETGDLWGTLKDSAAALGGENVYDPSNLYNGLQDFTAMLNSMGYTSIMTLPAYGTFPVPFDMYRQLEDEGLLTVKVHGATSVMDTTRERDVARALEAREKYNSDMVKMNTTKFFMDGVVDTRTAFLLEPYEDTPGTGMAGWDLEPLSETFAQLNEAGIQIHTHAIGDAALRMALDALEYARDNASAGDYRNAITHLQIVDPADIPRLGELDVVAVAQPFWHYKGPGYWDEVEYAAVGERARTEYPMKSLADTGAVIVSSSDFPVTTNPNPFQAMELGVTRNLSSTAEELEYYGIAPITDIDDPTYLLTPSERLTIEEMIESYTMGGAYLTFSENETGSLVVGKAADLIVLNQNLLEIDPLEISKTRVLLTYVNGTLVYDAAE